MYILGYRKNQAYPITVRDNPSTICFDIKHKRKAIRDIVTIITLRMFPNKIAFALSSIFFSAPTPSIPCFP